MTVNNNEIARLIDHTLLKPEATKDQIKNLIQEAKDYKFASVCINPTWVSYAAKELQDTPEVKVCTVIGFPLGASTPDTKAFETKNAIENGGTEVDMVINIGALKAKDYELVESDIRAVVETAKGNALTKVIIETTLLTKEEKIQACEIALKAGADFVKTSTGFSSGGATVEDIQLMRQVVGLALGVKASGGIRNRNTLIQMVEAGATRIGASAGVAILLDQSSLETY